MLLALCAAASCGDGVSRNPLAGQGGSGGTGGGSPASLWPGFVEIGGGLGGGCSAALASDPAAALGPLTFIPCSSGEACEELKWDGAIRWDPTGSGDLLEFNLQFARDAQGLATRLLVRHHYPIGSSYGPNPYEAALYDLATGLPLAVLRNVGGRGAFGGGSDCFIVPIATRQGLWLAGGPRRSDPALAGYLATPGPTTVTLAASGADATFLFNAAFAFDDRLALSQDDGKIVLVAPDGNGSTYGPGQRVWLEGSIRDRFLTANEAPSEGPIYFGLDYALNFTPFGGRETLLTDGANVGYVKPTEVGFEVWTVSAADGQSDARLLATLIDPNMGMSPIQAPRLTLHGTAIGDGKLVVLTYMAAAFTSDTGPLTAHVIDLSTGSEDQFRALDNSPTSLLQAGARQLLAYAGGALWFGETSVGGGMGKVLRVRH